MRVYHIAEKINELAGGTSVHITRLAAATADLNPGPVEIVAFDLKRLGEIEYVPPNVQVTLIDPPRPYIYGHSRAFIDYMEKIAEHEDAVFHVHNMWRLPMVDACARARKRHRPCMVTPHGALTPWSLSVKSARKKLLWKLIEERRLKNSSVIRSTSANEARFLHGLVPDVPIAMVPPGTDLPELGPLRDEAGVKHALFLSRLTPNKGLLTLIEAWAALKPKGWRLLVAGSDEKGHLAECQNAARDRGVSADIEFLGPAFKEKKWGVFARADLFIAPTLSENFGIAIAEAMAAALPVITTRGAPWAEILERRCGWWIELGVEPLIAAMTEAMVLARAQLRERGLRGRELIAGKYTWLSCARQIVDVYHWTMAAGPKPECIHHE